MTKLIRWAIDNHPLVRDAIRTVMATVQIDHYVSYDAASGHIHMRGLAEASLAPTWIEHGDSQRIPAWQLFHDDESMGADGLAVASIDAASMLVKIYVAAAIDQIAIDEIAENTW